MADALLDIPEEHRCRNTGRSPLEEAGAAFRPLHQPRLPKVYETIAGSVQKRLLRVVRLRTRAMAS